MTPDKVAGDARLCDIRGECLQVGGDARDDAFRNARPHSARAQRILAGVIQPGQDPGFALRSNFIGPCDLGSVYIAKWFAVLRLFAYGRCTCTSTVRKSNRGILRFRGSVTVN